MTIRATLRSQISSAWCETIENYYNKRLINSEGGLQAFFCAALLEKFNEESFAKNNRRRIFVAPCLHLGEIRRHPDIVICDSKNVIGVIELKYTPRGRPQVEKDVETLNGVLQNSAELKISNDRYLGKDVKIRHYPLAKDHVICWAGVHRDEKLDLAKYLEASDHDKFLELHAITSRGNEPKILANGRKPRAKSIS